MILTTLMEEKLIGTHCKAIINNNFSKTFVREMIGKLLLKNGINCCFFF